MYHVIIQLLVDKEQAVSPALMRKWAKAVLQQQKQKETEVTIRIVDRDEMTELNSTFRKKKGPTNVLSFPANLPDELKEELPILGDIVICADVVNEEAQKQGKPNRSHWAHMIVHGMYHLLGYDHVTDKDAALMEKLEIQTLKKLGFGNPYEIGDGI